MCRTGPVNKVMSPARVHRVRVPRVVVGPPDRTTGGYILLETNKQTNKNEQFRTRRQKNLQLDLVKLSLPGIVRHELVGD